MKVNFIRIGLVLVIMLVNVGCDQYSKQYAKTHFTDGKTRSYLGNMFKLSFVENEGAFLSLGSDLPEKQRHWALKVFPVIILIALFLYTLFSKELVRAQVIAFSFILGGGISNIYDRVLYNRVVDFMNMGIGDLRTGIFNFADVSIMIGLGIMLPFIFKRQPKETKEEEGEEMPATSARNEDQST